MATIKCQPDTSGFDGGAMSPEMGSPQKLEKQGSRFSLRTSRKNTALLAS